MPRKNASFRCTNAFQLLMGGSSVSMLGSRVTTIAYPMLVLYLTRSPAVAGLAVFAATAPSILVYIPAGALVDRWDPRRTMLVSESGRGIAIATVVLLLVLHRPSVPLIISMAIMEEILEVFAMLAERRYVRALVEPRHTSSALVQMETRTHVVVLAGRPVGGLLFELSPILPFLADAISFIVSVSALLGIRNKQIGPPAQVSRTQLIREVRAGINWLRVDRFSRNATLLWACMTIISQALIMIFLAEAHSRQLSSATIGIVLAASGLGGAFGALAGSKLPVLGKQSRIKIQPYIWSVALLTLAISRPSWQIPCMVLVMIVLGFTGAMGNVELDTYLNQRVPEGMLARVTSIGRLMSFSACAIGPILGGILIERYSVKPAVFFLFVMTLAIAVLSIRVPAIPAMEIPAAQADDCDERAGIINDLTISGNCGRGSLQHSAA
jgi:MFS family permease